MANYLLIESRDPFETRSVSRDYELAASLAKEGNQVTLFLVQNGVLPARSGAATEHLAPVASAGVRVLCDAFSLRERGMGTDGLAPNVDAAELDLVVDELAAGTKTVWL